MISTKFLHEIEKSEFITKWTQEKTSSKLFDIIPHFLITFQSKNTQKSYFNDIKSFLYFLHQNKIEITHIHEIQQEHITLWKQSLESATQSTLRRKLYSLSSLFQFALKRGLAHENPAELIQKPRLKIESKTNSFTLDEVKRILDSLKEQIFLFESQKQSVSYKSALLNHTVIATLFSVGMRVSELCDLQIGDLEIMGDTARLHIRNAKGKREHSPIIHQNTASLLQNYVNQIRPHAQINGYIFVRAQNAKNNSKITTRAVYNMIQTAATQVGITKKISPHSCRATLATLLHNKGVPILQIQHLLNHKSITTTSVYIKKSSEIEEAAATKINIFDPTRS